MIGIESTSRSNFERYMPKTKQLLEDNTLFLRLDGFNKIGMNSDPNISPILNGIDPEFLYNYHHDCYPSSEHYMDDCPFIWKNFSEKGYVTVFMEDLPHLGLFHFERSGFLDQPTDYYSSATHKAAYEIISHTETRLTNCRNCYAYELISDVNLEHIYNAFETFHDKVPLFVYSFLASFTHDSDTNLAWVDDSYFKFLTKFINKGYMDDTIILFYGDHGYRWGNFRKTHFGRIEENMPLMSLIFPHWFKSEYPETWRNLKANQHKLTSNYDIHLTLTDILEGSFKTSQKLTSHSGFGQSLFLEVPRNRSCEDAGIPLHYCACEHGEIVAPEREDVKQASYAFMDETAALLAGVADVCEPLTLSKVSRS